MARALRCHCNVRIVNTNTTASGAPTQCVVRVQHHRLHTGRAIQPENFTAVPNVFPTVGNSSARVVTRQFSKVCLAWVV